MSAPETKVAPWEDVVLRLIAIYKFAKALLALLLGLTLLRLMHHDIAAMLNDYVVLPLHLDDFDADSENRFWHWVFHDTTKLIQLAADLTPHKMRLSAYASFFYATVFAIEGTGLYLKKHWAEWMVLLVTGSFLLPEALLLIHHPAWWKVALIVGNLLIIGYLAHRLRLDYLNRQSKDASCTASPATPSPVSKPDRITTKVS